MTSSHESVQVALQDWYASLKVNKTALIVKGLRQIGKTTSVLNFCKEHFDNVVYINFLIDTACKEYFNGDLNVDRLIMLLSSYFPKQKFIPYKTVIIFDEIQECANARTAIKPFMLDGRFDIVATGSMLGLRGYNKKQPRSIPVGFESIIEMMPMDFEEFLWALGIKEDSINFIKNAFNNLEQLPAPFNKLFMQYFREYLVVGGMPAVVKTFIETSNMQAVKNVQNRLLNSFKDDFGKHLNSLEEVNYNYGELEKIMDVYNSIPDQLAKENKKFIYKDIKKKAKSRDYLDAIIWLEEYGLIKRCYRLDKLELPLEAYKDSDIFKIYVRDTGLLVAMLPDEMQTKILNNELKIYKGPIFENLIADSLIKSNKNLYYYGKPQGLELDFITVFKGELTVLEVKSTNSKSKALNEVLINKDKYQVEKNFKLIDGNIGTDDKINTIPLYMAFLIK